MRQADISLESRNLAVGYDRKPVAEKVSFTLGPGDLLVLLGPNGAGKTTLLKTLAGQLAPLGGSVYLTGRNLQELAGQDRARTLSLLLTGRPRAELMTCREVVSAGRYPYTGRLGILSEKDRAVAEKSMARLGVLPLAETAFDSLSDGQKQRVLLARALCQEPEVLVLDEPASYLDIRYQLELVEVLRSLAAAGLTVVVSLHELDLARRCGGKYLCLRDGKADRFGTAAEVFSGNYLETLYDLPAGSLEGTGGASYIRREGKRLRRGYTTGTCAALAAAGAARALLTGAFPETVALTTPKGIRVEVALEDCALGEGFARCGVRKDGGDDIDCTAGALICAEVRPSREPGVRIEGGEGVGRVTKPGLDQSVGEAAINSTPRRMICQALEDVCGALDYSGGLNVTVFVPRGEALAKKTLNADLGILGGISILGTSGIVEPMSNQALVDTIALQLRQQYALGHRRVLLTPGNYGMDFLKSRGWDRLGVPVVKCGNFIGESLEEIAALGYEEVLLVGHIGKLVKLSGGILNTHSRQGDCRRELFTAHAALCGGGPALCRNLMDCATTDACLTLLKAAGLAENVLSSLFAEMARHLAKRAPETVIGAAVFSNEHGYLGGIPGTSELLERWQRAGEGD